MINSKDKNYKKTIIIILISLIILGGLIYFLLRKPTYEITFDSKGGSFVASVKVKKGDNIPKPNDPVKENYIFLGWEYENEIYDFTKPVTKDMTLIANWEETTNGLVLETNSITLKPNEEHSLKVNILNTNIQEEDLIFSSSDDSIVKVDENGKITALKEGTVTITIKTKDGKNSISCEVVVSNKVVEVENISISGKNQVIVGNTIKLTVSITPDDATNKNITWKSSNTKIATIDKNGVVKGIAPGTVTITATSDNGKSNTKKITIVAATNNQNSTPKPDTPTTDSEPSQPQPEAPTNVAVESIKINEGNISIQEGNSKKLTYTINPANATNQMVDWESSNNDIVSVDNNGNIVALKVGTAQITVRTKDGNKTSTITVTVTEKPVNYSIYFQREYDESGQLVSYIMTIRKNNDNLPANEQFVSLTYNNEFKRWKPNKSGGVLAPLIDEKIKEAKIVINVDGIDKTFSASVSYGN